MYLSSILCFYSSPFQPFMIYLSSINKYGSIYLIIHPCNTCVSFGASLVKNPPANIGDTGSIPGSGRSPGREHGNPPTPVFSPGEFHGQRSLESYSPWGCTESKMTE